MKILRCPASLMSMGLAYPLSRKSCRRCLRPESYTKMLEHVTIAPVPTLFEASTNLIAGETVDLLSSLPPPIKPLSSRTP